MSGVLPKVKIKRNSPEYSNESRIKIKRCDNWSSSNSPNTREEVQYIKHDRMLNSFSDFVKEGENFTTEEILPDRIEGNYTHDYNILKIDNILTKKFAQQKRDKVKEYEKLILEEQDKMQFRQNMIERKKSRKKIAEYQEMIENWEMEKDYKNYVERTQNLLERYQKLGSIKQIVSFANKSKEVSETSESPENQKIRHQIIFEYLEQARKYIKIDLVKHQQNDGCCFGCGESYDDLVLIETDPGITVCPVCGLEIVKVIKKSMYADNNRVSSAKNSYEDRANFEKVVLRFQGKQVSKPDASLYSKLDEWFTKKGLPSSKEFNQIPLSAKGTKKGASKDLMYQALSEIGCSGYYDDINLICNIFYGLPLPDITHLEENIMWDYDDFQRVYDEMDKEGRKSSLNSQWKLYILLRRQGWKCKMRDFKIPTTPHILEYHKIITKQVYEKLGWECNF